MTISYGHGIAASPVHLAAAYASLVNGGLKVRPTLLRGAPAPTEADRVVSPDASRRLREILRGVVTDGTGRNADVPGYYLGGKTGTADKPLRRGRGYAEGVVMATFAGVFPAHDPAYVLVVTLDEAQNYDGPKPRRTAGWTAAPTVREALARIAPILGMRPGESPPPAEEDGRLASSLVRN